MLDEKSLIVTYKDWRGEPRASLKEAEKRPGAVGDCVDCNQCVAVCPTGIDIRQGPQVGCITCALCVDACDRVMKQVGRPRGLIDYATLEDCRREAAGEPARPAWKALIHPRTLVYLGVWSSIGLALLFALGARRHLDLSVAPDRNPPFMLLSDGSVRNAYTLKLRNMQDRPRTFEIALTGMPQARMWTDVIPRSQAARTIRETVDTDATATVRAYVVVPPGTSGGEIGFTLSASDDPRETRARSARFAAPGDTP
jgi:cytochrome c oxidase accessory protein FixG